MIEQTKSVGAVAGVGLALGQIVVWLLETFALAEPVPGEIAIAIGTVLAAVIQLSKELYREKTIVRSNPGGTD